MTQDMHLCVCIENLYVRTHEIRTLKLQMIINRTLPPSEMLEIAKSLSARRSLLVSISTSLQSPITRFDCLKKEQRYLVFNIHIECVNCIVNQHE